MQPLRAMNGERSLAEYTPASGKVGSSKRCDRRESERQRSSILTGARETVMRDKPRERLRSEAKRRLHRRRERGRQVAQRGSASLPLCAEEPVFG